MTAALNCLSTNQGFISFSKRIERKKKKRAQLLRNCPSVGYVEANPVVRLSSIWAFNSLHSEVVWIVARASYTCLFIYFYIYLYKAWMVKSGNVTAVADPGVTDCHSSSTEARPPAQALGYSPRDAASSSHPCQGIVAGQSCLLCVYLLYNDRLGNVCAKS